MEKKKYSDPRWWDNPMPRIPHCGYCKHYVGIVDGRVSCKAFKQIPKDIMKDHVVHDHPIEGDHGYRWEPRDPETAPKKLTPRKKVMDYD